MYYNNKKHPSLDADYLIEAEERNMGGGRIPSSLLHDTIIARIFVPVGATYRNLEIN